MIVDTTLIDIYAEMSCNMISKNNNKGLNTKKELVQNTVLSK